ncbi:MAG: hypothetical protein IKS87_05210 [Lachnospiraceae bacterium]|nr:hypothetical protein [Lachnospiraceae bacterium]
MGKKKVNRTYKDTVFRLLFGKNRKELLDLYNAVNDTHYTNAENLEINTLEEAIYVGMRNDISFVFRDELSLYEHQSTLSPNLPLRNLFYVADLLQEMTAELNIYSSRRLTIPTPEFYVFYNGEADPGKIREYRLSEMFSKPKDEPCLELVVKIININDGQDNTVLEHCRTLREYAKFVAMIRANLRTMKPKEAVTKAVDDCIKQGILKEFLIKHKAQVIKMSIYEYDAKKHMQFEREEGREEGRQDGLEEGDALRLIRQVQKKIAKGKTPDVMADELESSVEEIQPIYDVAVKYPTDTDPKIIFMNMREED